MRGCLLLFSSQHACSCAGPAPSAVSAKAWTLQTPPDQVPATSCPEWSEGAARSWAWAPGQKGSPHPQATSPAQHPQRPWRAMRGLQALRVTRQQSNLAVGSRCRYTKPTRGGFWHLSLMAQPPAGSEVHVSATSSFPRGNFHDVQPLAPYMPAQGRNRCCRPQDIVSSHSHMYLAWVYACRS